MDRTKWFFHPLLILVFSILALAVSLFLYIYWYLEASAGLKAIVRRFNLDAHQVLSLDTWVVILVLSILVGIILMGIFIIFVYNLKTLQLFRMQHNFINNFTHELKTPVTSLKLYLETFSRHELSRQDRMKYLQYMIVDVGRLSDNISRILNLAKIESKSYKGEFLLKDPADIIEQFYKNNAHLFQGCRIHVDRAVRRECRCRLNPSLFEMLLMNISTNAVTYNDAETPTLDISIEDGGKKIYIRFKDNGKGLEKTETRRIFRKFYQVGRPEDRTARGSGIGLYLVDQVARIHKGKIAADSRGPGRGTTFTLSLPCKTGDGDASCRRPSPD